MKAKVVFLLIISVLFVIFILQNTEVITIKAFFWAFEMSAIILISFTGLLGVIAGFILAKITYSSRRKNFTMEEER
jgi:uncharacterized integral membrane protein